MSTVGILFLFVFLPASLAVYYIFPVKARKYVLLGISIFFYSLGSYQYALLFVLTTAFTVILGRSISKLKSTIWKRIFLIVGILCNIGLLFYYKYTGFALGIIADLLHKDPVSIEIILPLGISFFTFKAVSYLVDIYKGKAELSKSVADDALYLSFFPQITSGPLSRYNDMQFGKAKVLDATLFSDGVYRFLRGFGKKVLLADVLSNVTNEVFATLPADYTTAYVWLGSICYSLELLLDFEGYSDMAIGLSEMFGYECPENFNYPYMTESVAKFWRRWHISLGAWFRDYVYIPMGGSRTEAKWRIYFNLFTVWILTGIWHGAEKRFIVWGLAYFFAIAFERLTGWPDRFKHKVFKVIYRIATLFYINFLWVIFNAPSLKYGLLFIKKMVVFSGGGIADRRALFLTKEYAFFIALSLFFCFPVVPFIKDKAQNKKAITVVCDVVSAIFVIFMFVAALSFIVAGHNNPFLYGNF